MLWTNRALPTHRTATLPSLAAGAAGGQTRCMSPSLPRRTDERLVDTP